RSEIEPRAEIETHEGRQPPEIFQLEIFVGAGFRLEHVHPGITSAFPAVEVLAFIGALCGGALTRFFALRLDVALEDAAAVIWVRLDGGLERVPFLRIVDGIEHAEDVIELDLALENLLQILLERVAGTLDVDAGRGDEELQRLLTRAHARLRRILLRIIV